jgi:hypothetical protein
MTAIASSLEDRMREELLEKERLEVAFEGLRSRWLPWTFLGEFLSHPCAIALTDRRVLFFEIARLSSPDPTAVMGVPRSEVRAGFRRVRRWQWTPVQGGWSRVDLGFRGDHVKVYVDRASRDAAAAFVESLSGQASRRAGLPDQSR